MLVASSSNFLIPNWTFVAELLIFVIVLAVMAKVVLPPLSRSVSERADGIRRSVQRAELLRAEAARATAERRQVLAGAREDARAVVDEAVVAGEADRRDAHLRGQAEHGRLVGEARDVLVTESAAARRDMTGNLPALIAAAAERVIGIEVDPARHPEVLADAVAALAAVGQEG